jgi:hypothetical protein
MSDVVRFVKWKQRYPQSYSSVYYREDKKADNANKRSAPQLGRLKLGFCFFYNGTHDHLISKIVRPSVRLEAVFKERL